MKRTIKMTVNNDRYEVPVEPNQSLVEVLRNQLGFTGTKVGCGVGDCGSCIVIMDHRVVNSCLVLALEAEGRDILTIEGLETEQGLHPLQEAFMDTGAIQCGFCTPGMIMAAKALLDENPEPDEAEIREGISGVLCRCTGYRKIVQAVTSASQKRPRA